MGILSQRAQRLIQKKQFYFKVLCIWAFITCVESPSEGLPGNRIALCCFVFPRRKMSYLVKYPSISSHLPWEVVLGQHLSLPALVLLVRRFRHSWPQSLRITAALESRLSVLVVGGCGRTLCQRQHCDLSVEWEREKPRQKQACCSPKVVKEEGGEGTSILMTLKCMFHNSEHTNYKCHTLGFIRLAYFHN